MVDKIIDAAESSDWIRGLTWELPPYKSPQFMRELKTAGLTLREFRKLPVYKNAVQSGYIKDDEWVSNRQK